MNIVDYVIIGIIGISVLFGLYRGFIASVLNMGCGLMSFLASFWVSPKLAAAVQSNQSFLNMLLHYTDASSRIGDLETAITNVATLTSQSINSILEKVNLPAPLDTLLRVNLENNVYASSGLSTVSDYVSQTILQASINIICFLVSFLVLYIVLAIVLNLLKAVFRFPILKQLNGLAGGRVRLPPRIARLPRALHARSPRADGHPAGHGERPDCPVNPRADFLQRQPDSRHHERQIVKFFAEEGNETALTNV